MKLCGRLLSAPRELCSRMHCSVSICTLPLMTSHLCIFFLSGLFSILPVSSKLVFSTPPEDGVAVLGAPLTLHCAVYDSRQQRALSVLWERASSEPVDHGGFIADLDIHQLADGSLVFPRLRERQLGKYVCSAGAGAERISAAVRVEKAGLEDVFFSPQAQTVREGEAVFLQCVSGESSPPAHITWLKDGSLAARGRQIQGQYGGGSQRKTSSTLHLPNVTLEDDGIYICVTHNPLQNISRESKAAKLTVLGLPKRLQITEGPDNITVAMGTEAFMRCAVRGFPVPMVHWFKDGCLLTNCSASFSLQDNGQLLVFRNVSKEDEGSYHCEASNQRETIKSQSAFLLPAVMGWHFVQQPTNLTVKRGENATVICRPPYSRPTADISWFKNNRLLIPKAHFAVMPSGDLFFHSVQESDSGTYFCRASSAHLHRSVTSRRVTLTVLAPPSVKLRPQVVMVPVGAQVVLECQAKGHPPPSISWLKRGHSVQTGGKIVMGVRNATLYILSVRSYDEGIYTCEASNLLGRDHSTATLQVAVSPIIVSFAGQVSCRRGASVVLPCRAVGIPPITYTWTRGRAHTHTSISPNEDRHTADDGALHISNVQWHDAGVYYCTAENRAGRQQRQTTLTITAEDHPADRDKQTRQILSASTNIDKELPVYQSSDSWVTQHPVTTNYPRIQAQHKATICPAINCDPTTKVPSTFSTSPRGTMFGLKGPPGSLDPDSQLPLSQPTTNPTHPIVTQMQPPLLPPPPYLNFQSAKLHTQPPVTSTPFFISNTEPPITYRQSSVVNNQLTSIQYVSKYPVSSNQSRPSPTQPQLLLTAPLFPQIQRQSSPAQPRPLRTQTRLPQTPSQAQPRNSPEVQTSISTVHPPVQSSNLPTSDLEVPVVHQVTTSDEIRSNGSQQGRPAQSPKSANKTELTEWLKRNTSQSPMTRVTQQSPSWLPVLEKHDIPIVVGVGVSLAFIFITMGFYSLVQKNEPAPTSRAAQRNLGVPIRHAERRAAGRTYENRAFEDDDCVAVIEQSPNTADTRARPPVPSLVTVQMDPTSEDLQEDTQLTLDDHSITVETYPEPILDTEIDPPLEEEKGCSLSQPSIQLKCVEDWASSGGDNHGPCQDALPPPSSLPSHSPSPSPPPGREEGLRSSLTLQTAEPYAAPVHHSLSISHGTPPLLISHHVSLGLTTVAVDVHFYPTATAAVAVATSTHINSVANTTSVAAPLFNSPLANSQENDQSAARTHQSK